MATISNVFASSFVSASKSNESFVATLKKSGAAALEFAKVSMFALSEGEQTLKRTIFSTGEIIEILAPQYVTVGMNGTDSDIINTEVLRWWNQTLSLATLGATENLQHEYIPFNNAEIGKYFFAKQELPKRGLIAVIKLDAWMGAKIMKNVRIGNLCFDLPYPEVAQWTDDSNVLHSCQWYGITADSPSAVRVFGIGADDSVKDVLVTEPTLRNIRFGREYMNRMFSQMTNLVEGKQYRMAISAFERTGHRSSDQSEFQFIDWSLVNDAISTVERVSMEREEAVYARQATKYAAAKLRRADVTISVGVKAGALKHIEEDGVANIVSVVTPATDEEKARSVDYIYADFKDGAGMNLVSVNDKRFRGYFQPVIYSAKSGSSFKKGVLVNCYSSRNVIASRISGVALIKE